MLTKDSKSIIKFIENNFKISNKGFNELKLLYNKLNNVKNNYKIIKFKMNENENNLIFENPFVSDEIKKKVRTLKYNCNIIIKINNINTININIYHNENNNIKSFIENIITVISYICNLLNKNIGKMNINYYLTDFKKNIDNNIDDGLKHGHINNGCCSPMTNTIDIWRKEEIMKVTIHEMIHLFNCDKTINDTSSIIKMYQERYKINSINVNTFEAYTEIWANILNSFILSNTYNDFILYINLEKEWCKFQSKKIFYITNLNKNIIDINKYTNVLAYFIIRCELYNNFKEFIKLFYNNICCNSSNYFKFLKNLNKCKRQDKLIKNINKKNYIYKTLRMSAIEYKLI